MGKKISKDLDTVQVGGETLKQSIGTVSRALKIGTWERYEGRRSINL